MLSELRVQGLGVIDDVTIELADGLTVITGETGAGKTLIVTGLSLLCGARGDSSLLRDGADAATIEALVDGEDGQQVVSRRLTGSGNRIRVNDGMGTVGDLREWAAGRIEIHGQHEHLRLADPAVQRGLLDRFAGPGHLAQLAAHHARFDERASAVAEREVIAGDERVRLRLADQLRHELDEIDAAAIDVDTDEALADRLVVLEAGEEVQQALAEAAAAMGEEGAAEPLGVAVAALRSLPSTGALDQLADRAIRLTEDAAELARDLRDAADDADVDPAELDRTRERLRILDGLRRKFGEDLAAVLAHADEARERLAEIDGHDDRIRQLDDRVATLDVELAASAAVLLAGRTEARSRLVPEVMERLGPLGMPHAVFEVALADGGAARDGGHEVTFTVAVNPGEPPVTLAKGASGGEQSRVALAIETALADADETSTLVFDEVDAGIGGETAKAVGAALAVLAHARADRQVLCVTHLAQVAAHADVHHVVTKQVTDRRTVTRTRLLSEDERPAELARMIGGADSNAGLAHAVELLEDARARLASARMRAE